MTIKDLKRYGSWPLNDKGDLVVVKLVEVRDEELIDVRKWVLNESGDLIPTLRGVLMPVDVWNKVVDEVGKVE